MTATELSMAIALATERALTGSSGRGFLHLRYDFATGEISARVVEDEELVRAGIASTEPAPRAG